MKNTQLGVGGQSKKSADYFSKKAETLAVPLPKEKHVVTPPGTSPLSPAEHLEKQTRRAEKEATSVRGL